MISINNDINNDEELGESIGIILSNSGALSNSNNSNIIDDQYKNNLISQDDEDSSYDNSIDDEEKEGEEEEEEEGDTKIQITNKYDENNTEIITPLPKMKIFAIFIIMLCDAINSLSIFPYVNFLVGSFKLTPDSNKLGYYVGILASSYYIAQLIFSFFWGWFSNYKGRRPTLLMGLIGSMICLTGVGFSRNYASVIIFRFLSGALNGNVSCAKTMLGEITDSSNQARAFSVIGLSWGVGGIIAPLIGGFFSNVCTKHPGTFSDGNLFCKFPYLLPNVICVLFSLLGLCLGYFYLQESKSFSYSSIPLKSSNSTNNLKSLSKTKKIKSSLKKLLSKTSLSKKYNINDDDDIEEKEDHQEYKKQIDEENIIVNDINNIDDVGNKEIRNSNGIPVEIKTITIEEEDIDEFEQVDEDLTELPRPISELVRDRPVIYACLTYAFLGFMFTIFEEVFPNWTPSIKGGYGFSSNNIGTVQSTAGVFALFIQLLIFPKLVSKFGLLKSYRMALLIAIPSWIILPELSRLCVHIAVTGSSSGFNNSIGLSSQEILVEHPTIFWALLFPTYMFQSFASEITFITIIVMVSNSALPKDMALVNSIGMALVSISRSFGPTIAGVLLAFSLSHSYSYPFDQHMVFYLLAFITVCLFIASFSLPESLNYDKLKSNLLQKIKNGEISQDVLKNMKSKPMVH